MRFNGSGVGNLGDDAGLRYEKKIMQPKYKELFERLAKHCRDDEERQALLMVFLMAVYTYQTHHGHVLIGFGTFGDSILHPYLSTSSPGETVEQGKQS